MPFTLAHAAAVLPLPRLLGRWCVPSALVLGSFMPDLGYFLALPVLRTDTHTAVALLWFSLPAGLLAYVLFHRWLKAPLMALLPADWLAHLHNQARSCMALPHVAWGAVVVSILCGAATHNAWDAFTHRTGWGPATFAALLQPLPFLPGLRTPAYILAQHSSSVLGILVVAAWCWRWRQRTPPQATRLPLMLAPGWKLAVLAMMVLLPLAVGLGAGMMALQAPSHPENWSHARRFISAAVTTALPTFSLAVLGYVLAWHRLRPGSPA